MSNGDVVRQSYGSDGVDSSLCFTGTSAIEWAVDFAHGAVPARLNSGISGSSGESIRHNLFKKHTAEGDPTAGRWLHDNVHAPLRAFHQNGNLFRQGA